MNRLAKIKNYRGVTFMELIIVMAIISIFAVMSYSAYNKTKQQAEVEAVCSQIASLINQTRNDALVGKKVTSTESTPDVNGEVPEAFRIVFRDAENPYSPDYSQPGIVYFVTAYKFINSRNMQHRISPYTYISKKVKIKGVTDDNKNNFYYKYDVPTGEASKVENSIEVYLGNISKTVEVSPYRAVCK